MLWKNEQPTPFGVFSFPSSTNFFADGKVFVGKTEVRFELYTDEKSRSAENSVEKMLEKIIPVVTKSDLITRETYCLYKEKEIFEKIRILDFEKNLIFISNSEKPDSSVKDSILNVVCSGDNGILNLCNSIQNKPRSGYQDSLVAEIKKNINNFCSTHKIFFTMRVLDNK